VQRGCAPPPTPPPWRTFQRGTWPSARILGKKTHKQQSARPCLGNERGLVSEIRAVSSRNACGLVQEIRAGLSGTCARAAGTGSRDHGSRPGTRDRGNCLTMFAASVWSILDRVRWGKKSLLQKGSKPVRRVWGAQPPWTNGTKVAWSHGAMDT